MASLRGPHHCLGIATAVTEIVFRHLHTLCDDNGGSLSKADLDIAKSHALRSFSGAFSFFEGTHQRCMEASASTAPGLFDRDNILASLLQACGHKAARPAFAGQLTRFGEVWLTQFFSGMAGYVRTHIAADADTRLNRAYAALAAQFGAKLSMADLLKDDGVRGQIEQYVAPLVTADAAGTLSARLSDFTSQAIATQRGIPKPDLSKVTEQEVRNFLTWLPRQIHVALSAAA